MSGPEVYMPAGWTPDHVELAAVARKYLASADAGRRQTAALGWYGIGMDEDLGGAGGSFADLAPVLEACGEVRADSDLGWTAGVALAVLTAAESSDAVTCAVERIVRGDAEVALAVDDPLAAADENEVLATGSPEADYLLLPIHSPGGGVSAAFVSREKGLLSSTAMAAFDPTRPLTVHMVDRSAAVPLTGVGLVDIWRRRRAVVIALDAIGTARGALQATVDYARTREQFGTTIGSFQAFQHRCASAYVSFKAAQALAYEAARRPDDECTCFAAAMEATRVATLVCGEAVQLHGGVGFTWEFGIGSALRRARADELMVQGNLTELARIHRGR
ncbi:acyl-CoA dehydrogenase family protein [Rhodococcus sp. DMU1]|uniref:acyl-CoA dehydrogenase family protein n=1 Tax=Rhodococcus sp. DMU1 TaxID=2722825 RepID=UPI00143E7AFF|nr:acyl-CoA dehydrogenase family protein [Rhodococcus sp. DMU1]QIX53868.1 acyl-CoA/acyl-ACP dehydrogenase [Rhodococcus sp. DMU1]